MNLGQLAGPVAVGQTRHSSRPVKAYRLVQRAEHASQPVGALGAPGERGTCQSAAEPEVAFVALVRSHYSAARVLTSPASPPVEAQSHEVDHSSPSFVTAGVKKAGAGANWCLGTELAGCAAPLYCSESQ
jgi:hypothetical protein